MEFSTGDVTKIIGIKRITLNDWITRGFVCPSIHKGTRPGDRSIWSHFDLYKIAIFKKVTESGFSRRLVDAFLKVEMPERVFNERLHKISMMLFMRRENEIKGMLLTYEIGQETIIDIWGIIRELEMEGFDDVYILNFRKIKVEVYGKVKEVKGDDPLYRKQIDEMFKDTVKIKDFKGGDPD